MAEPISIQQLKDASEDAISLAEFINKPENTMIPRRLASDIHSLQYYLEYMKSFAQRSYETYDEMVANASNLSENVSVFVTNDLDSSKNGIYTYNGTSFVKGEYQPENAAKEFVESKLGGLEVFDGKVRAQDVSTVDGSTQDAKNIEFRSELDALPFEGGVLADTFVTMTKKSVDAVARNLRDVNNDSWHVKDFGVVGDGIVDDTINLQKAIYAATEAGKVLVSDLIHRTTDTIIINGSVDFRAAEIYYEGIGHSAVQISNTDYLYMLYATIHMPKRIRYVNKPSVGWDGFNTIGVEVVNLLSCKVHFGNIRNFKTNLVITSKNISNKGQSTCYNEFYIGHLDNGFENLLVVDGGDSSWVNENNFFGGRYSHNGGEGTNVVGVRHIALRSLESTLNNNVFYKPSIESDVPEYHVEMQSQYTRIVSGRWEATPPKVLYKKITGARLVANQATNNLIDGGYTANRIEITKEGEGGAFLNTLIATSREIYNVSTRSGGVRYSNTSGDPNAVITVFGATTDIDTADISDYALSISANGLAAKKGNDVFDRVRIAGNTGEVRLGQGTSEPEVRLSGTSSGLKVVGGGVWTSTQNDLGTSSYKWGALYLAKGAGFWGVNPPAARPVVVGDITDGTALKSLLTALASYGLITDSST